MWCACAEVRSRGREGQRHADATTHSGQAPPRMLRAGRGTAPLRAPPSAAAVVAGRAPPGRLFIFGLGYTTLGLAAHLRPMRW